MTQQQTYEISHVPLDKIELPDIKLRESYDGTEEFAKLEESIAAFGIQQPIRLRPHKTKKGMFELCDGCQRHAIAGKLGHATVPAYIGDLSDDDVQALQYNLNERRLKTKLSDKVEHLHRFITRHPDMDRKDVAKIFAMQPSELSNLLSLKKLHPDLDGELANGMPLVKAFTLARIPMEHQSEVWEEKGDLPTDQFINYCDAFKKQLRKAMAGEKVEVGDVVAPQPLKKPELLEKWEAERAKFKAINQNKEPEAFLVQSGRLQMIEECLQIDAVSLKRKEQEKEARSLATRIKNQQKKMEEMETARKQLEEQKARLAELQTL